MRRRDVLMRRRYCLKMVGNFCSRFGFVVTMLAGCGFDRLQPDLPDLEGGLTLAELEEIQDDERLTTDEKRERIREAINAPMTESGERLVDFLLSFNVP